MENEINSALNVSTDQCFYWTTFLLNNIFTENLFILINVYTDQCFYWSTFLLLINVIDYFLNNNYWMCHRESISQIVQLLSAYNQNEKFREILQWEEDIEIDWSWEVLDSSGNLLLFVQHLFWTSFNSKSANSTTVIFWYKR